MEFRDVESTKRNKYNVRTWILVKDLQPIDDWYHTIIRGSKAILQLHL